MLSSVRTPSAGSQAPTLAIVSPASLGAQNVFDKIAALAVPMIEQACAEALSKADDALFDLSQRGQGDGSQQQYFEAMREIRVARSQMEQRFHDHIAGAFQEFKEPGGSAEGNIYKHGKSGTTLSLLAEEDLEEQLAGEQTTNTISRRYKHMIEPIDNVMARMAITMHPIIDRSNNPISPEHMTKAFREALTGVSVGAEVKLVLLKLYERELLHMLDGFYPEVAKVLSEAGYMKGTDSATPRAPAAAPESGHDNNQVPQRERKWGCPNYTISSDDDEEMLNSLHELLQTWRSVKGQGAASGYAKNERGRDPDTVALSPTEMLSVLSLFQSNIPDSIKTVFKSKDRSLSQQIKHELITGAGALGINYGKTHIGVAEEDAIDVVGMMFEVFLDERDMDVTAHTQISRLLVPYIKVALLDRRLFMHKAHPARRLLNAIAEACEGNHGEGERERELLDQVGKSVDRLISEFNEDLAIFELLEQELRSFIEQYKKRADLAERRSGETYRGKERLEAARANANSILEERMEGKCISPLAQADLRRYWCHHYSVIFLRNGENDEGSKVALKTLEQMLALAVESARCAQMTGPRADDARTINARIADIQTNALMPDLMAMLASSGLTDEAAKQCAISMIDHLTKSQDKAYDEQSAVRAQVADIANDAILNVAARVPLKAVPSVPEGDPSDVRLLRTLKVGDWVDFITEETKVQHGKLSWVSPISGRLLFVNRRGLSINVLSIDELAAMMKANQLRMRVGENAFEQTMQQVMGRLRGGAPTAEEPSAA
jgi:hypothetical protein